MKPSYSDYQPQSIVESYPKGILVDFSRYEQLTITAKEISRCFLRGNFTSSHRIANGNIVRSKMYEIKSENASFNYVDFKDSSITNSSFDTTSFDFGAIINCRLDEVAFYGCTFENLSITDTFFSNVTFEKCDLSKMVIEGCRFYHCQFLNCITSNKLFEICLLMETRIANTDLQIETITDNFGVSHDIMDAKSRIRTHSTDEAFDFVGLHELEETLNQKAFGNIEKFKIQYFLFPSVLETGSTFLDATFEPEEWLKLTEVSTTFVHWLKLHSEFLMKSYDNNNCSVFLILKLHSLTAKLASQPLQDHNIYGEIMGVHMAVARRVEPILELITLLVQGAENPIKMLVNGPISNAYYETNLPMIFDDSNLTIVELKKHNSPNELILGWEELKDLIPLISIFIATRFQIEVEKLKRDTENGIDSMSLSKRENQGQSFLLHFGVDDTNSHLYGLKLRAIFPGELLVNLRLNLSTKLLASARTILVGLLESKRE